MTARLHQLSALGRSVWIDFLSRELLDRGRPEPRRRYRGHDHANNVFPRGDRRPNLLVKIPASDAGVPAIEGMTGGYAINVTLIFSLTRHRQVAVAYLRGLERLVASGGEPSRIHSVASFFVSRVDTEADRRLHGERWDDLASRGATPQRCPWASTSVKNPRLRDTLYVEEPGVDGRVHRERAAFQ